MPGTAGRDVALLLPRCRVDFGGLTEPIESWSEGELCLAKKNPKNRVPKLSPEDAVDRNIAHQRMDCLNEHGLVSWAEYFDPTRVSTDRGAHATQTKCQDPLQETGPADRGQYDSFRGGHPPARDG